MSEVKEPKALFRRGDWQGKVSSGRPPLWHRWAGEVMADHKGRTVLVIMAACEYEVRVESILAADGYGRTEVQWRDEVKTASRRCKRCDKKHQTGETNDGHDDDD